MSALGTLTHARRLVVGLVALLIGWSGTPAATAEESLKGPDVTIIAGEEKTIFEYRQNGQLRMVRIVPSWGKPYYLVPRDSSKGHGDLEKAEMLLPSWVIVEF